MRKYLFAFLSFILSNSALSQSQMMKVHLNNGSCFEYQVNSVDSVTFYVTELPPPPKTEDDSSELPEGISIATENPEKIYPLYASLNASFLGGEGIVGKAYKYGMCLGKEMSPDISNVKFDNNSMDGVIAFRFDDLEPNTLYYYRAVLYYDGNYYYGISKSFTTPDLPTSFGYVDLGLSVKWGTCNVGADSSEEPGDYFAWGETETKDSYKHNDYKYYDANVNTYINIGDNISGTSYDAASVNCGTEWRMPTLDEISELYDECFWQEAKYKGVAGYLVSSKTNGNCMFVPTVSCTDTSSSKARYSQFWSATSASLEMAYYLNYNYFKVEKTYRAKEMDKPFGLPVRPVHD